MTRCGIASLASWVCLALLCCRLLDLAGAVRAPERFPVHPAGNAQWASSSHTRAQANVAADEGQTAAAAASASVRPRQQQQQQQDHVATSGPTSASSSSSSSSSSRHLSQFSPTMLGPQFPADLSSLDSLLAAARDAFAMFEPHPPAYDATAEARPQSPSRTLATGGRSSNNAAPPQARSSTPPGTPSLQVSFVPMQPDAGATLRLPPPPRSFNLTVATGDPHAPATACRVDKLAYADQAVPCPGLRADGTTRWVATLVDADADDLVLTALNFTLSADAASQEVRQDVAVELGQLSVEAAFGELAWAGMYYPRPQRSTSTIIIHAQIVGAQIRVYTQQNGTPVPWDVQWTGDDGTAAFFLVPGVRDTFFANMSVGETVLKSSPLMLESPSSQDALEPFALQPQQQQLVAAPQLLCTGEVEEVRGDAGTFPQSLAALEASSSQAIYHPRGFVCRWELVPEQPDVLLSIDYRGLLPDEVITLVLGPNNVIQLTRPADSPGAVYQASLWVEHSILVAFQSTRTSTSKVGAFSVSWTSIASGNRGLLDSKTMVIVLACVSAAGALLAACCFYFVCCGRRRRAAQSVVVDSGTELNLMRVPSAVRSLLPSKPYQAPEPANPLPGAATEPDCCSVCLVEFEQGELVTVLPCMHFYHQECIGSWLKRNCTCPLCKSNVLTAFHVQQADARHAARRARRQQQRPRSRSLSRSRSGSATPSALPSPAAAAAWGGGLDGASSPAAALSRRSSSAAPGSGGGQLQQRVELTVVQPASPAPAASVAASPAAAGAVGASRTSSPWTPLEGATALSPASAAAAAPFAGAGNALVALSLVPPAAAAGGAAAAATPRLSSSWLPPLARPPAAALAQLEQQQQHALSDAASDGAGSSSGASADLAVHIPRASATAADGMRPLVIPPSPSPSSYASLQYGTVHATPEDFAPAAAAAAAALAQQQRLSPSATPGAIADAALAAAQASVAALRTSSQRLGRRLHGLVLSPTSRGASPTGEAAAGAASSARNPGGGSSGGGGGNGGGEQERLVLPGAAAPLTNATGAGSSGPPRLAVSIYAYAGHPLAAGGDEEQQLPGSPPSSQQQHHQ